ncbi:Prefoldin subunit-domain-containing protein [Schizothecium vesticola]|uniref:Prefoldin subunit-domain-containing protein n=1 Tax=Schizothecium vesticola TaxID=314040 RepID=A0AA40F9S3_9PEZI|nr:Prefoldin subunit-domain-containing protein [Schizothecium vesticola]
MAQPKDLLSDLDKHIQNLQTKVTQYHASLTHWQKWYLEYSTLHEEVDQLPKDAVARKELARIKRDWDGDIITKKEVNEIFGKNDLKAPDAILGVLSRRLDYVERNIEQLQKLLSDDEAKLSAAVVVANPDPGTDEETGLPLTGIIEELDDDDNVVSYRLQTGPEAGSQIADALMEAGIGEIARDEAELDEVNAATKANQPITASPPIAKPQPKAEATTPKGLKKRVSFTDEPSTPSVPDTEPSSLKTEKKSVSFADDTKPGHRVVKPPAAAISLEAQRVQELMRTARESEAMDMSRAVIPDNESAEDSALRRDMLNYMQEINPVVAELEILDVDDDDDDDDDDEWEATDMETDDEDELGRSQHSVITDDYIQRMKELEQRLKSQSAFASPVQPAPVSPTSIVKSKSPTAAPKEPKSVKFASKLDIAEEKAKPQAPKASPIRDIVEDGSLDDEEEEEQPKRVSRFKKQRAAAAKSGAAPSPPPGPLQIRSKIIDETPAAEVAEPAPPEGQTLASSIVERNVKAVPREPDDMDDVLLYQAASVEYNRLRNKMIQKQGGFLKVEEQPTLPPDEGEIGAPRVSRFKAARMAKP